MGECEGICLISAYSGDQAFLSAPHLIGGEPGPPARRTSQSSKYSKQDTVRCIAATASFLCTTRAALSRLFDVNTWNALKFFHMTDGTILYNLNINVVAVPYFCCHYLEDHRWNMLQLLFFYNGLLGERWETSQVWPVMFLYLKLAGSLPWARSCHSGFLRGVKFVQRILSE